MKRLLIAFILFVAGCLVAASGWAAGGASPLLPGGAALGFWRCDGGSTTEIVVENVRDYAVLVHLVLYDRHSQEIMNFSFPLSEHDVWGGTLSCDQTQISIVPWPSHFPRDDQAHWAPLPQDLYGFLTVAVTAIDSPANILRGTNLNTWALASACDPNGAGLPCADNDPRNDFNWTNQLVKLPNAIILRTMFVNPAAGWAVAVNGLSLVDFINLGPGYLGADDTNGIKLSQTELLAFQVNPLLTDGGTFVVGSPIGRYVAHYLNEGGFTTSFFLMIPFSGNRNGSRVAMTVCEDDHTCQSLGRYNLADVELIPFPLSSIYHRGLIYLTMNANHGINFPPFVRPQPLPIFGYSLIEGPGSAAFYYVTPANKVFCIQGQRCIREGIRNAGLY